MSGGGEHAHVRAGFGDEDLGDDAGEPGNADQQVPGGTKGSIAASMRSSRRVISAL